MSVDLATLIAHVESDNRQFAMRFEPHVYGRASNGQYADSVVWAQQVHRSSRATAAAIISTSWGLFQIMGFNLYHAPLSVQMPVGQFMATVATQNAVFQRFCRHNKIWLEGPVSAAPDGWWMTFARTYNGPGAPTEYVKRMKQVLDRLENENG